MKHYSRLRFRAYIFILSIIGTDATVIKGNLPSIPVVAKFLNEFIKPMINNHGTLNFRANAETSFIKKIIHDKIKQLKPVLQDNDISNEHNTLTLEGEDDTHILEFLPGSKQALRFKNQTEDVEKFKKMQKKIKKALNREPISEDSKRLILKSVDEMVAHIVSNKCVWTSGKAGLRNGNSGGKPFTFNHMWNHLLDKMQTRYKQIGKGDDTKYKHDLKHFQEFVSGILNDTQVLSEDYRVVCSVVNVNNMNVTGTRTLRNNEMVAKSKQHQNFDGLRTSQVTLDRQNIDQNETCPYFKVCSEELSDFMTDFFINLNDTAVSTLTNYAAMFVRDVKEDYNNEKQTVIKLIYDTSFEIVKKISVIFKKQTEKFSLHKSKDKDSNIHSVRQYIKKTVNHVKRQVINDVALKLKKLRPKLRVTIEKDIDVNLDVDLGNLEKELSAKICMIFEICNGKYVARRNMDYSRPKIDKNHLFVRVQLTLDDKKKPDRKIALGVGQAMRANGLPTPYNTYAGATRTDAPFTKVDASSKRTDTSYTRTDAPTSRTDAPSKRTDVPTTRTDRTTTRTEAPTTETDVPTTRTDAHTTTTDAPSAYSMINYTNLVQNNVKLTSAEIVKSKTSKSKHEKHDKHNEVKLEHKSEKHKKNKYKFKTIKSLETYHETRFETFTEIIPTNAKKISSEIHKPPRDPDKILTDTDKPSTGTIQISTNTEEISRNTAKILNHGMTIDENAKKKKHRAKKYKKNKYNKPKNTKFKTIESLDTYRETRLVQYTDTISTNAEEIPANTEKITTNTENNTNFNLTIDEYANNKKQNQSHTKYKTRSKEGDSKIKSDNENIYKSRDDNDVKREGEIIEHDNKTEKVHRHSIKPSDLLGNHSKTGNVNVEEFKFNMTLGSLGTGIETHIEKHYRSKKHMDHNKGAIENQKENKEIKKENGVDLRSHDFNNTESCKSNGTHGECEEDRRSNNLNETIDDIIENQKYDTIQAQIDGNTETEDEYYYDYENSTEIIDGNGNYDMYESEYNVNNGIEASNKEKDNDVKAYNVKRRTFVDLEERKA